MHTYTHTYMRAYIHTCIHTYTYYIHKHIYTYIHKYTYIHTHTYTYTLTYIHTYIHIGVMMYALLFVSLSVSMYGCIFDGKAYSIRYLITVFPPNYHLQHLQELTLPFVSNPSSTHVQVWSNKQAIYIVLYANTNNVAQKWSSHSKLMRDT